MEDGFELFTQQIRETSTTPCVTLQQRGYLGLNRHTLELLGKPEAVQLLYNSAQRIIGLRPTHRDAPYAYPVRTTSDGRSAYVASLAFIRHYGLTSPLTRRYEVVVRDSMLVIDLNHEPRIVTPARSAKPVLAEV